MIHQTIAEATERVLARYLGSDLVKQAAADIAQASASAIQSSLADGLRTAFRNVVGEDTASAPAKRRGRPPKAKTAASAAASAAPKKRGRPPKAKAKAAPKKRGRPAKAKAAKAVSKGATKKGRAALPDNVRKVMSFKKAVFHAQRRKKEGTPQAHDALILAAEKDGKVISVEWAKKQTASASAPKKRGRPPKATAAAAAAGTKTPKRGRPPKAKKADGDVKAAAVAAPVEETTPVAEVAVAVTEIAPASAPVLDLDIAPVASSNGFDSAAIPL